MCRINFFFEVGIASPNNADVMNIMEQIAYVFSPSFTVEINEIPELNIISDIPITLTSVSRAHSVEQDFSKLDIKSYTFNFILDGYFYPPVFTQGVITKTFINVSDAIANMPMVQAVGTALGPDIKDGIDTTIHRKESTYEDPNQDRSPPFYGDVHHPPQDSENI